MAQLKVLHIIWSAKMGGIATVVFNLAREQMKDSEVEPSVMIARNQGELLSQFKSQAWKVFETSVNSGFEISPKKYRKLLDIFKDFDLLHFHCFHPLMALAAARSGKKIIYTEHGNFGIGRSRSPIDIVSAKIKSFFLQYKTDFISFNSRFTQKTAVERYGAFSCKNEVIFNGILNEEMPVKEQHYKTNKDQFLVASIGRLAKVKRFDRVIEAFATAQIPNSRLVIMGDGPERKDLELLAEKHRQNSDIIFTGTGAGTELLAACDLSIIGSAGEAFGLTAVESYRAGKKVLVFSDGGGLTEIVAGIEPDDISDDINSMASKLKEAGLHANELNSQENTDMRRRYSTKFSIKSMADHFKAVYITL